MKHVLEGKHVISDRFDVRNMLPDDVVEGAVQRYWMKFLGFASWIGHFTTAVIGFYMVGKAVKFIIDTVIHGKILYDIYGIGWQLIAAFWDSFTSLLSHRYVRRHTGHPTQDNKLDADNPAADASREFQIIYPLLPSAPVDDRSKSPKNVRYDP